MKKLLVLILVLVSCTHKKEVVPPPPVEPVKQYPVIEDLKGRWTSYSGKCSEGNKLVIYTEDETNERLKDFDAYFESKNINELRSFEERCHNMMTYTTVSDKETTSACITHSEKKGSTYKVKFINPYVAPGERTMELKLKNGKLVFGKSEWIEVKGNNNFHKKCP